MNRNNIPENTMIDFVKKTTEAITIISESTKEIGRNTRAVQKSIATQNTANGTAFESLEGKMDGLITMFKYVVVPLITGILALVGIKMVFKL